MGAWIEIDFNSIYIKNSFVAPLVGAWIEIVPIGVSPIYTLSLPSWERGLKSGTWQAILSATRSLPSWERGLKFKNPVLAALFAVVAPLVGAWIEISILDTLGTLQVSRSPRGSVD